MSLNPVNTGTAPNNGTGDNLRLSFQKLNANDAFLKVLIESVRRGTNWKPQADLATTGDVTLSGEQTIDGVATSTSRILVKDQTDATENGIYVTNSGAWSRSTDADTGLSLTSATISIAQGTDNADTNWTTNADNITLGTTEIVFIPFVSTDGVDQGTFDAAIQAINTELATKANDSEVVKTIETSSGQVLQMDANGKVVLPDFNNISSFDTKDTDATVTGTKNIDWNKDVFVFTLTGDTTFSDINLPTGNNVKTIVIYMTGDFIPTFPAYWDVDPSGSNPYDGTVRNRFVIDLVTGDSGSEDVTYNNKNL